MKTILISILFIIGICSLQAQNATTKYDTCSALHQYEGEWLYANGIDTIKIYLRFSRDYGENLNVLGDDLAGWHEYKQGNTIIESNYQYRNMVLPYLSDEVPDSLMSISLHLGGCNVAAHTLWGGITDYHAWGERHDVKANLITTSGITTMYWKQEFKSSYGAYNPVVTSSVMTLPKQFILIKQ